MQKKDLITAAKKSIIQSVDTLAEGVDLLISAATESELLESVPLVQTGVKLLKARDAFRQQIFIRNCYSLLEACKSANQERRDELWNRLAKDEKTVEDFVDTLLLITTESSKPIKAELVGKLIAALANESITYEQYDSLAHVVHSASIPALLALPRYVDRVKGTQKSGFVINEEPLLMSAGLGYRYGSSFNIGDLGKLLYEHGFSQKN